MKMKRIYKVQCLAAALLMVVTLTTGCGGKVKQVENTRNVTAVQVSQGSIRVDVDYAGRLEPATEVNVASKTAGKVEAVKMDAGMEVKAGDVLFTLNSEEAQAQYNQSKAAVDNAKAALLRTSDSSLSQQLLDADQKVKQAQLQYDDTREAYDRGTELYGTGGLSKQELDGLKMKMENARLQLDTAKSSQDLLKTKSGPQSVSVAQAQLEQAEAAESQAMLLLKNLTVTSPVTGRIASCNITAGEILPAGTTAFTIIDSSSYLLQVGVSGSILQKLKPGQLVDAKLVSNPEITFQGMIETVSPLLDPKSQTYAVKIRISGKSPELASGLLARVSFPVGNKEGILTIPNEAIVSENGIQYIFTVRDGIAVKKLIETGMSDRKQTEVTSGLSEGELAITEGQSFLSDGDKVQVNTK